MGIQICFASFVMYWIIFAIYVICFRFNFIAIYTFFVFFSIPKKVSVPLF